MTELLVPFNKMFFRCQRTGRVLGTATVLLTRKWSPLSRLWAPYGLVEAGVQRFSGKTVDQRLRRGWDLG